MQSMIQFARNPDEAASPVPIGLREGELEKVRGFYADGLVRQIWLRGDAGRACMIVPLKPYSGFAPRP